MSGIDIGSAAMHILNEDTLRPTPERPNGPSLAEVTERVSHLTGTKAELLEAVAYLACQVNAYRRIANEDAALAIVNIETVVRNYRERRA